MYMTEITESKFDELVENAEKMLRYGGKVMSCLDSIQRGSDRMGERSPILTLRTEEALSPSACPPLMPIW